MRELGKVSEFNEYKSYTFNTRLLIKINNEEKEVIVRRIYTDTDGTKVILWVKADEEGANPFPITEECVMRIVS